MFSGVTVWHWTRLTWLGWLAGIPLVALFALLGEAFGIGGAQVLVGIGIGSGVGIAQGRALRSIFNRTAPWVYSCAIGLSIPFLFADILRVAGFENRYALQAAVAIGGTTTGVWQAYLLRSHTAHPACWVPASALGWTLAALSALAADLLFRVQTIRGLAGALAYLALIGIGGLILGASTGVALVRLLARRAELAELAELGSDSI